VGHPTVVCEMRKIVKACADRGRVVGDLGIREGLGRNVHAAD
jgi:hypothetical protein